MNIFKKVVIFVMGVVVIGVVATTIGVVTRPKNVEKSVTFELLDTGKVATNVYDNINKYTVLDNNDYAINIVSATINNVPVTLDLTINNEINEMMIEGYDFYIEINGTSNSYYTVLDVGDIITITFEVEQETPVIIKTLIFLIPLILSASLIGYLAFKKGEKL